MTADPATPVAQGGPPLWIPAFGFAALTVAATAPGVGIPRDTAAPTVIYGYAASRSGLLTWTLASGGASTDPAVAGAPRPFGFATGEQRDDAIPAVTSRDPLSRVEP